MELFLLLWGILIIVLISSGIRNKRAIAITSLVGIVIDAIIGLLTLSARNLILEAPGGETFQGFVFFVDPLALFFKELFCLILFISILISIDYSEKNSNFHVEYYALLLFIGLGMMIMASAGDFLLLFLSMELVSIPLYILAGFNKKDRASAEAGLKYFILGAFSSALLLYGISLLYGYSGSMAFIAKGNPGIFTILSKIPGNDLASIIPGVPNILVLGTIFLILGFGFKIAAAPFHMWAPDVYEGAPIPVTAFISVGPKAAGIAVIIRFFAEGLSPYIHFWAPVLAILAMLSILIGNLAALRQTDIRRLLAYSGIAQMGYILLGFIGVAGDAALAKSSVIFYLTVYVLTNLGAFAVATLCSLHYETTNYEKFTGLQRKSPSLAFIMALAMLSLAGIPPLAGFMGKFYLFASAYTAYQSKLAAFVLIAIIFSVMSLFYYLNVLRYMFFEKTEDEKPLIIPGTFKIALSISTLAILLLGLTPSFYTLVTFVSRFLASQ